jgi:hypothetical protein
MTTAADTPFVGQGATYTLYTDSYACTVVSVSKSGKSAVLQRDKATLLNGANSGEADALVFSPGGFAAHVSGVQRYSYETDPEGETFKVSRRAVKVRGKVVGYVWKRCGHATKSPGCSVSFGHRSEHYDYNF